MVTIRAEVQFRLQINHRNSWLGTKTLAAKVATTLERHVIVSFIQSMILFSSVLGNLNAVDEGRNIGNTTILPIQI